MIKSPQEITESLYIKGISFLNKSTGEIICGGIMAGIFVSLAAVTSVTVCSGMSAYIGAGFTKLIFGIVFTLGLILIVFSGSELFTGSNMYIAPVYDNKKYIKPLIGRWSLVFLSNFVGAVITIVVILKTGVFENQAISSYMIEITEGKLNLTLTQAFARGILCNFLVCLAVRVGEASKDVSGRIFGYIYVIGAFVINGFEHSIANMFFIPVGIILGGQQGLDYSWQDFFINNLLPVAFGNIIGGAIFVSTVYYFMHRKYFRSENNKNARSDNYEHIKN
jgi:formate/nitrite transporter